MKLISLKLRNFKGCHSFTLEPDGNDLSIFGDNGTFKTTLFDAFCWLLFDKDSANRKDFEIKTLGADGQPVHGLEHEVEAMLDVTLNQREWHLHLKKVYCETWTKKRGSVEKLFTGHSTSYFLDGVPAKKNEYEAMIASIVDEGAFRLLTNPRHFNEVLHWQERRKILLDVCGDLSDADVIAADSKLATLPEILGNRKLEDHRKVLAARRTEINKEIERIPVRISEVQRGLPYAVDATGLIQELEDSRKVRAAKAQELATLEAGGGVAGKTKELRLVEAEILKAQREQWTTIADEVQAAKVELRKLEDERAKIDSAMAVRRQGIEEKEESITQREVKLGDRRQDWSMINSRTFTFEQSDTCPVCGQTLPPEQLEAAREKAKGDFNLRKASDLALITDEGRSIRARVEELNEEVDKLEREDTNDATRLTALNEEMEGARAALAAIEDKEPATDPAYVELTQRKTDIELDIEKLKAGNTEAVEAMRQSLTALDARIADYEATTAHIMQREGGLQRIEELKAEERTLAEEFERLEGELYLTEQFVRTKVSLLEDRINKRFHMARFKLFNQLVNGGVEEVCETIYLGVPYGTALNNSARINIGLDIINTLSEHYQFVAPIFIDNAEAVTRLLPTKGQQIRLYVSEVDNVLRIEK